MDICESFTINQLGALRAAQLSGEVENNAPISGDIYASWDDEEAKVAMTHTSEPGELLHLKATIQGRPRWLSLNGGLGTGTFAAGDVLCLVAEGSADKEITLAFFIRSAMSWGLEDTYWAEPLVLPAYNGIAAAFHTLAPVQAICGNPGYHTLVINLPVGGFDIALKDLRLLRIPASRGLSSAPVTLSSVA